MISSLPSSTQNDMPGVGFPRWRVELNKIRNGRPGCWEVEFAAGRFRHITQDTVVVYPLQKRTG
jgi:protein ImuA